jgi:two-component system, OmpR family, alkaline phosphatase synthesis response regulator PhoP
MANQTNRKRVLVVEDDDVTREVLVTILDLEEFDVVSASDGRSALGLVESTRPDIVLLDVMMPEMDGITVCRQIKDDPATTDIAVVLLTAKDDPTDREAGERAGCDLYLTKPFSPRKLIEHLAAFNADV